ncbi:MAG: pitrilysin family protein [bacterium]
MLNTLKKIVVVAVCLMSSIASAQSAKDVIQKRTLPNGLDVIVVPSPGLPIATIEICVKNGAFTETPDLNGLSHLYEHMFFKGNAVIPNQEAYLRRIRQLGIVFNGTTSSERVNYFFTLPSDQVRDGLVFMKDAITTPKFDPVEFEKEKKVVLGEVDRNESDPYYWFNQAMSEQLWYQYPSRKDALGDRATIETATIAKMQTMKDTYYVPNNAALLISGNVDANQVFSWTNEIFGGWKRSADPFKANPVPQHPPLSENKFVVVEKDVQVPFIEFSLHGPSVVADPKATFAADVLSYILSQPASKFQKNLVDSGITLGAGISYYTQKYTGPISISAQVMPENVDAAINALRAELPKMIQPDYFSDEQLESAKTILAIEDLYGREKLSSFTHTISFWWATASLDYYLNYVDNLKAVTRADIVNYLNTYVLNKPYVLGILLSPQTRTEIGMSPEKLKQLTTQVQ